MGHARPATPATSLLTEPPVARWLYQGLGRIHHFAATTDLSPYAVLIADHALHNPIFDRQANGSRAAYLFPLFARTHDPAWFRTQILRALAVYRDADESDEDAGLPAYDFAQLCDVAVRYAQRGDRHARQLLYETVSASAARDDDLGMEQLVALDGVAGFQFVAEQLGLAVHSDPDPWEPFWLHTRFAELLGADVLQAILTTTQRPGLIAYRALLVRSQERRAAQIPMTLDNARLADIVAHIATATYPRTGALERWGVVASAADLDQVVTLLRGETDPQRLRGYLPIFAQRPFPAAPALLVSLIHHPEPRVAGRAIGALAQVANPMVRQLGLDLLAAGYDSAAALTLFESNYAPGDEALFSATLAAAQDDGDIHEIQMTIRKIYDVNPTPAAVPLLTTCYETGPCALCRTSIVELLLDDAALPPALRAECAYDAERQTRALVGDRLDAVPR